MAKWKIIALASPCAALLLASALGQIFPYRGRSPIPPPAEIIREILAEYDCASRDSPDPQDYAARLLEVVECHPDDPAAVDALIWILDKVGPQAERARQMLMRNHLHSEKLAPLCRRLDHALTPEAGDLLRAIAEQNPHPAVRGQACLSLARSLETQAAYVTSKGGRPAGEREEAEQLLDRVLATCGDVPSLAAAARAELTILRDLVPGTPAPEIEGQDLAGRPMKLIDYRGKVVVLDFWAHW
jgi:hypothetical protein